MLIYSQAGANPVGFKRRLQNFNNNLKDWGPLIATLFGILVSIGFGILGVFALLEAKTATQIAYDALMAAKESNDLAKFAVNQSYVAYDLNRAQFLMNEITNCQSSYPVRMPRYKTDRLID